MAIYGLMHWQLAIGIATRDTGHGITRRVLDPLPSAPSLFSLYIYESSNPYPWHTPTYHTIPISVCLPPPFLPLQQASILIHTVRVRAVPSFSLTYLNPIHFLSFICTCSLLPFHTLCASSISFLGAVLIALLLWSSKSRGGRRRQ